MTRPRLLLVCVLLIVVVPPAGAGADNGRVKRAPTKLWNAYPLVETPDPVIAIPTRTSATATPQAEEVPSAGPFSPSQPSMAVTVAVLAIVASTVAVFAFMTLQTASFPVGQRASLFRRRRRLPGADEVSWPASRIDEDRLAAPEATTEQDGGDIPPAAEARDNAPDIEHPARRAESDDEPPASDLDGQPEKPVEAEDHGRPEKELAPAAQEVEVLRAKRRERVAEEHAALVAKLKP
jgi:hypothetical protein